MQQIEQILEKINIPQSDSHKGQNGRLLIIGGSHLFHAASIWSLTVASRIVDLVHYASVEENNKIVVKLKEEFRNGIVVHRSDVLFYIEEDDCILIGPGMVRSDIQTKIKLYETEAKNFDDILKIDDEGVETYYLTKYLLSSFSNKKWVIDAGALQMLELNLIPSNSILTPHLGEFERLKAKITDVKLKEKLKNATLGEQVRIFADKFCCVVVLKGIVDYIASPSNYTEISGGNAGMTKGGTGDVLAGLIAALNTTNDTFTSAAAGSYINKKAGEELFEKSGLWFNASDLANQIPQTMKKLLS